MDVRAAVVPDACDVAGVLGAAGRPALFPAAPWLSCELLHAVKATTSAVAPTVAVATARMLPII